METVKCAQCGLLNAVAAESCMGCGAELKEPFGAAAWPGAPTDESQRSWTQAGEQEGPALSPRIGPFTSIGAVLHPTIEVFKNNFWLITKMVVVVFAPYEILKGLEPISGQTDWQFMVGIFLLALACNALVAPALIYSVVTVMRTGRTPGLSEAYRWGLGRLGRIMVCALLAWILQVLGFICLIVPGIILSLAFTIVYPMAALEERGPVDVLERSWRLTKGYKGRIFVANLVAALLCWAIAIPVGIFVGILVAAGVNFRPIIIVTSLMTDVINQFPAVLALIIYLSIVQSAPQEEIVEEGPAAGGSL